MGILSFKEIHRGRDGDATLRAGRTIHNFVRVWRVQMESNFDNAATVFTHQDVPKIGDLFPDWPAAYCQGYHCANESFSKRVWIFTANYSTEREVTANPLDEPARVTLHGQFKRVPIWRDKGGNPILNTAGDPYDPPLEGEIPIDVWTVRKNVGATPEWLSAYRGAVNSSPFVIRGHTVAAKTGRLMGRELDEWVERNGIAYCVLTLTIHEDPSGWAEVFPSRGFREVNPLRYAELVDPNMPQLITGADGRPVTSPALLDGDGKAIDSPTPVDACWQFFEIYNEQDFNALPLT